MKSKKILFCILILLCVCIISACSSSNNEQGDVPVNDSDNIARIDDSLPRVVDKANMLTDEEESKVADLIEYIYRNYGADVLVMTFAKHESGADDQSVMNAVWERNGYGTGETAAGWIIFICKECKAYTVETFGNLGNYSQHKYSPLSAMEKDMHLGKYCDSIMNGLSEIQLLYELGPEGYENYYKSPTDSEVLVK